MKAAQSACEDGLAMQRQVKEQAKSVRQWSDEVLNADLKPQERELAAFALGGLANPGRFCLWTSNTTRTAADTLSAIVADPASPLSLRRRAVLALSTVSAPCRFAVRPNATTPVAVSALVQLLREGHSNVEATHALAQICTPTALGEHAPRTLDLAVPALNQAPPDEGTASALRAIGDPAVRALVEDLRSSETPTRLRAATLLGQIGPAAHSALPSLLEMNLTEPNDEVRRLAAVAVWTITEKRDALGIRKLLNRSHPLQKGLVGTPRTQPDIVSSAQDPLGRGGTGNGFGDVEVVKNAGLPNRAVPADAEAGAADRRRSAGERIKQRIECQVGRSQVFAWEKSSCVIG
jgi:hypothetical protein